MPSKSCECCGSSFEPVPQVPGQSYCSRAACQRTRRQRWYQEKLVSDPDYRDNKRRSQRGWMDRNPGYWQQYRAANPEYAERNRRRQREPPTGPISSEVAKIDASVWTLPIKSGIYRITPIQSHGEEKNTVWTVEIAFLCDEGGC